MTPLLRTLCFPMVLLACISAAVVWIVGTLAVGIVAGLMAVNRTLRGMYEEGK